MRQNGYYWVVYDGKWTIAEYFGKYWGLAFDENVFYDQDFTEIDERPITKEQFEKGLQSMAQIEATKVASKVINAALEIIDIANESKVKRKSFTERLEEMKSIKNSQGQDTNISNTSGL